MEQLQMTHTILPVNLKTSRAAEWPIDWQGGFEMTDSEGQKDICSLSTMDSTKYRGFIEI